MSKFRFKPEDFSESLEFARDIGLISEKANQILDAHLATLKRVYGRLENDVFWFPDAKAGVRSGTSVPDTHTALLFDVEEIKPNGCEHRPFFNENGLVCADCKLPLKSKGWEVVSE